MVQYSLYRLQPQVVASQWSMLKKQLLLAFSAKTLVGLQQWLPARTISTPAC